jgi:glyoxylase-like metal-dependent hydrolase (beta-lactamase superfamily II)
MTRITRRDAVVGLSALAASAALNPRAAAASTPAGAGNEARADEPQNGSGFYRFKVGSVECFSIGDSQGRMPSFPLWGQNASEQAVHDALKPYHIKPDAMLVHFNVLLLKVGAERWLVDAGNGSGGNRQGQLPRHLGTLGVTPADISGVIISHVHGDHYNGLTDEAGNLLFTNARYLVNKTEHDFWTGSPDLSGTTLSPEWKQNMTVGAAKILAALEASGRLELVDDGASVTTGVSVRQTGGHTPGHQVAAVESAGERFEMIADAVHHFVLSFRHPEWHVQFDYDVKEGARVRRRNLERLAADGLLVMGYHTPWPGVGRVRTEGDGFAWLPSPWEW